MLDFVQSVEWFTLPKVAAQRAGSGAVGGVHLQAYD
jgi:hypothetical protein